MAAKPTLREIARANAAMMPPENPAKLVRKGSFRGWQVRVYEPSWLPGGARFFMCADRVLPDGRPELRHDAEGETSEDVDAWIRGLPLNSSGGGASNTARGSEQKQGEVANA